MGQGEELDEISFVHFRVISPFFGQKPESQHMFREQRHLSTPKFVLQLHFLPRISNADPKIGVDQYVSARHECEKNGWTAGYQFHCKNLPFLLR